jgi:2-methylcitrate dehydratase PrpD
LLLEDLGVAFRGDGLSFKPYPCGRPLHAGIDAALAVRAELGITDTAQIEEVTISVDRSGHADHFESGPSKKRPTQVVEAQFALPFLVATALACGRVGIGEVAGLGDAATLALSDRIRGKIVSGQKPRGWLTLTVRLTGGRTTTVEAAGPIGSPEKPLTLELMRGKFRDCAANAVRPIVGEDVEAALAALERLEELDDVGMLTRKFV